MDRFENFLKGKSSVMGSSAAAMSFNDFPPLSSSKRGVPSSGLGSHVKSNLEGVQAQTCWSSLFGTRLAPNLRYQEPDLNNGKKVVKISHEIRSQGLALWEYSLIRQFYGTAPHKNQIQAVVYKLWERRGRIDILVLENDSFILKFEHQSTKAWVLEGGPWFILQKPLFLKKWEPRIVEKLSFQKFPLRIKLWNAPLELFTIDDINCIASAVGTLLYIDRATKERQRVSFARVCEEASWEDILPKLIDVDIENMDQLK